MRNWLNRASAVVLVPYNLAKRMALRDAPKQVPSQKWNKGERAPAQRKLHQLGVADRWGIGKGWLASVAALEALCHAAHHARERAEVARLYAEEQLAEKRKNRADFEDEHGADSAVYVRSMSHAAHVALVSLMVLGETYLSMTALLVLNDVSARWAAALSFGLATALLASAVGSGLSDWKMKATNRLPLPAVAVFAAMGLVGMSALAVLRQIAFKATMDAAFTQVASDAGSSGLPSVPWFAFLGLQLAVISAASWCSFRATNWLASEHEHLEADVAAAEASLEAALDREQAAADLIASTRLDLIAAHQAACHQAEVSAAWNQVSQNRYGMFNQRERGEELSPEHLHPIPIEPQPWMKESSVEELAPGARPNPTPAWHTPHQPASMRDEVAAAAPEAEIRLTLPASTNGKAKKARWSL